VIICGLDEAGRGPLAGPLVAAGVILETPLTGLNDSKKLKYDIRKRIFERIINSGAVAKTEIISVRQINNRGIGWANKEIFKRLIKTIPADKYIVDGNLKIKVKDKNVKCVVKADATRKCVMAASIIAKVTRDRIMEDLHKEYPRYGWKVNMGYGTRTHIAAIREYGTVKYHRDIYVTTALREK
jgi:ribonuclease HII